MLIDSPFHRLVVKYAGQSIEGQKKRNVQSCNPQNLQILCSEAEANIFGNFARKRAESIEWRELQCAFSTERTYEG